jgi:hypothetical protein
MYLLITLFTKCLNEYKFTYWKHVISVSTETRLLAGRPAFDSRQGEGGDFLSLRHPIQTDSGAHPGYMVGTCSAEVKNE